MTRTAPILAIVGNPGAGKTYWRERITARLGWQSIDVQDFGEVGSGRWRTLIDHLATDDTPTIVESCATPEPYRLMLRSTRSPVVLAQATDAERWKRLLAREPDRARASELFRINRAPLIRPGLTLTSQMGEAEAVLRLVALLKRYGHWAPTDPT